MADLDKVIRARLKDWVENCLDPQATATALEAVLDECDRIAAHGDRRALAIADRFRVVIADELGVDRG